MTMIRSNVVLIPPSGLPSDPVLAIAVNPDGSLIGAGGGSSGPARTDTAVVGSFIAATHSQDVRPANPDRLGLMLTNTDPNPAYVTYGPISSPDSFTVALAGDGGHWAMPAGAVYTGELSVIWPEVGSPAGTLQVTEL